MGLGCEGSKPALLPKLTGDYHEQTRTTFVALAALATTALSSTSASAFGAAHFAQGTNKGSGLGGAPNPAVTHHEPRVPDASVSQSGGTAGRFPRIETTVAGLSGQLNAVDEVGSD